MYRVMSAVLVLLRRLPLWPDKNTSMKPLPPTTSLRPTPSTILRSTSTAVSTCL